MQEYMANLVTEEDLEQVIHAVIFKQIQSVLK